LSFYLFIIYKNKFTKAIAKQKPKLIRLIGFGKYGILTKAQTRQTIKAIIPNILIPPIFY